MGRSPWWQAVFAYSTNYLIDVENAVIFDVETTAAIRQAEVSAARLMGDSAHGSADMLAG